jgi:hypothetical protein
VRDRSFEDAPTIVVQADTGYLSRETPWSVELPRGKSLTFGRGTERQPVDIVLDDPAISRIAGRIDSQGEYWEISNLSRAATFVVDNPDSGGFIKIAAGRIAAPIPFEFSRVSLPTMQGSMSFLVTAPDHRYGPAQVSEPGPGTQPAWSLDRSAKYFSVLVALCEPQLRERTSVVIPTVPQITERLAGLVPTEAAAYGHIDYLAEKKLKIREPRRAGKADWQRSALVTTALRYDLVHEDDLLLLPRRPR